MKQQILTGLSAMAAAVALSAASSASAAYPTSDYLFCLYKGNTTLAVPAGGLSSDCYLTLAAKIPCDGSGEVWVTAGGSVGAPALPTLSTDCSALMLGNFPWETSLSFGTADMDPFGNGLPSVFNSQFGLGWAGTVNNVSSSGSAGAQCGYALPQTIEFNNSTLPGYMGGPSATLTGDLDHKNCIYIP